MKNWIIAPSLILLMAAGAAVQAQDNKAKPKKGEDKIELAPYKGPKKRIAVMQMETPGISTSAIGELVKVYKTSAGISTSSDIGLRLTEMLTTALDSTGRFILLERAAIQDIRDEQSITAEMGTEQTKVKKGNVLGAQMLIRAAVTEFAPNKKSGGGGINVAGISLGGAKNEAAVTIDLRFIDPNTSQVLFTAKAEGSSKSEAVAVGISLGSVGLGGGAAKNEPIEKATRNAIEKAVAKVVEKMAPLPWEAKVATITPEGLLVLNRGANDGLQIGDSLKVYKPGATITDPDTGEVLGRDEDVEVGTATITWLNERLSRATFTGSAKAEGGMVLKLFVK